MLRLTFLLCISIFLAQLIAGRDFGQMRPGLVAAAAKSENVPVTADVPEVKTASLEISAKPAVADALAAAAVIPVRPLIALQPEPTVLAATAAPETTPAETVVAGDLGDDTVLTLAALDPAGGDGVQADAQQPENIGEGEIWYVAGNSLNVRAGPSTNDEIVGRLTRGEATLVVWREGEDWARIRVEGDGIEGYVALRFLTPEIPVFN